MTTTPATLIVKSGTRASESFDQRKLWQSIRASCLSERAQEGTAETTADRVSDAVVGWLEHRPEVTSSDLRRIASHHLARYHPGAAYLYEHYKHTL